MSNDFFLNKQIEVQIVLTKKLNSLKVLHYQAEYLKDLDQNLDRLFPYR